MLTLTQVSVAVAAAERRAAGTAATKLSTEKIAPSLIRILSLLLPQNVMLIQQKPALRINPLSEKSMNPGAIKIG